MARDRAHSCQSNPTSPTFCALAVLPGLLPGQGDDRKIIFAKDPWWLFPDGRSGKPLDDCCGWVPSQKPSNGVYGYATDDIFYLEVLSACARIPAENSLCVVSGHLNASKN